jgi:hypothetical protein
MIFYRETLNNFVHTEKTINEEEASDFDLTESMADLRVSETLKCHIICEPSTPDQVGSSVCRETRGSPQRSARP